MVDEVMQRDDPVQRGTFPHDWTEDHGDRLFSEGLVAKVAAPHAAVVVGLLLLCLIPRVWAGTLHDILCPDSVSYVRSAEALESGDMSKGFEYTGVNIYQPLLLGLKLLPGDWLVTAKWWSVAMAVLAVLPLYGWIRRQFNETLAILGCGFYALHPAMIHDSPLIVRDPTFWLLFALGLYVAWRAVSELRYRWFACFAVVFGLAIHLRTEAWLLAPVLFFWVAFRLRHARGRRAGLILATLLAVGIGPLGGKIAHEVVFAPAKQAKKEAAGNVRHLRRMARIFEESSADSILAYVDGTQRIVVRYVKAFGYFHLLLAMAGVMHWKWSVIAPSKGALLLFFLFSGGAIWACFCFGEMDRRYTFSSILVSLPTIGAGLCLLAVRISRAVCRVRQQCGCNFSLTLLCLAVVGGGGLSAEVATSPRPLLYDQAEIGRWIRANFGAGQGIAANIPEWRLVLFYARSESGYRLPPDSASDSPPRWFSVAASSPRIVLIWLDWQNPSGRAGYQHGLCRLKEFGFQEVPSEKLPEQCRHIQVLVREGLR